VTVNICVHSTKRFKKASDIAPFTLNLDTRRHWWMASQFSSFNPRYRTPGIYRIGGWVDPTAGLDIWSSILYEW